MKLPWGRKARLRRYEDWIQRKAEMIAGRTKDSNVQLTAGQAKTILKAIYRAPH